MMGIRDEVLKCIEKRKKILELGCGSGDFSRFLSLHGMDVTGLDPNAREAHEFHYRIIRGYAEALPFEDMEFDAVVSVRSLHHMDAQKAVAEAYRVLTAPGTICIVDWKKGANTGISEKYLSPREVKEMLHRTGFRNVGFMPCPEEDMFMVWGYK